MRNITTIVVHHSASPRDKTKFSAVNEYHKTKNWGTTTKPVYAPKSSLGYYCVYHWFIEADGKATQCRTDDEIGWHATVANPYSIGICLAGWFDPGHDLEPTEPQKTTLIKLLQDYVTKYAIRAENIVPHRKFSPKSCYGSNLPDNWASSLLTNQKTMFTIKLLALYNRGADVNKITNTLTFAKKWLSDQSGGVVNLIWDLVDASTEDFKGIPANEPNGHQIIIVDPVQISSYGYEYEKKKSTNYDAVCLMYNSDTIKNNRPTNPAHNPTMFAGFTTLQIASDVATVQDIMHEFFIHELLHGFSTLIRERAKIDFPDTVHNYSGISDPRPIANIAHLFNTVMKPYWKFLEEQIVSTPQPTPDVTMKTYKKKGEATVYVAVGKTLIPFNTDWVTYQKDFATASLVELSEAEFSKYKIAQAVKITNK